MIDLLTNPDVEAKGMGAIRDLKKNKTEEQEPEERLQEEKEFDFDESEMESIADERRGARHVVSLNPKLGRVVLYKSIYKEMESAYGSAFEYVQVFLVGKYPQHFWVRPCKEGEKGAKKLHRTGETRMVSAKMLLTRLGKDKGTGSVRFTARWDSRHNALVVDVSQPA